MNVSQIIVELYMETSLFHEQQFFENELKLPKLYHQLSFYLLKQTVMTFTSCFPWANHSSWISASQSLFAESNFSNMRKHRCKPVNSGFEWSSLRKQIPWNPIQGNQTHPGQNK